MMLLDEVAALRNGEPVHKPVSLSNVTSGLVEITGENGAGKTTLLRTLAGLHTQFDGHFEVGRVVFQGHRIGLDESLSAIQNLTWSAALADRVDSEDDVVEALKTVGMLRYALTPVGRLSQGQQRRIAMARWLLDGGSVWLLDEPLTALDINGQSLLAEIFSRAVERDKLVVYSTHSQIDLPNKLELVVEPTEGDYS